MYLASTNQSTKYTLSANNNVLVVAGTAYAELYYHLHKDLPLGVALLNFITKAQLNNYLYTTKPSAPNSDEY